MDEAVFLNVFQKSKPIINYKNVIKFFKLYDDTYADVFIQILLKFQDDNLPKEMLELLLEGDENEQAYSAKFFEYMPCPEAINVLNDLAFEEFEPLSDNAILALAKVNDRQSVEKAYQKLTSKDDFEVLQGIKILTTYPELSQLDKIVEAVKIGVAMAGGTPIVFPAIAVCDGIAMGHNGMKYSLITRDMIADSTEAMVRAHGFDGLVMVPNCDKIVPGMLMAARRLNLPAMVISGGPMLPGKMPGDARDYDLNAVFEAVGAYKAGIRPEKKMETDDYGRDFDE